MFECPCDPAALDVYSVALSSVDAQLYSMVKGSVGGSGMKSVPKDIGLDDVKFTQ